jgi:hypothetical protein
MRDRVFRTTRGLLRRYKEEGRISGEIAVPHRRVRDEFINMTDHERALYDRIETYISRYYNFFMSGPAERKPLGFIMTVYRRRLTSSFHAIQESLRRRLRVLREHANILELLDEDDRAVVEASDSYESLPEDIAPDIAEEISELTGFLQELEERPRDESKLQRLDEDLSAAFRGRHDTAIVFTQYADTMDYLANRLKDTYGSRVVCYSGRGGQRWDPSSRIWVELPKQRVRELFREGREVKILIGTDSLSEGLNLQTCGRLINYDMPWNFMRVEQRIGRIDRVGGLPEVEVTNYFYNGTVEEQIYTGIKEDFDWFEDVVGPAQPVIGQVERAIEAAAMQTPGTDRSREVGNLVQDIREQVEAAQARAITIESFEGAPSPDLQEMNPAINLAKLKEILTAVPATAKYIRLHPEIEGAFLLELGDEESPVVFERGTQYLDRVPSVKLLTYATDELKELLRAANVPGSEDMWLPDSPYLLPGV